MLKKFFVLILIMVSCKSSVETKSKTLEISSEEVEELITRKNRLYFPPSWEINEPIPRLSDVRSMSLSQRKKFLDQFVKDGFLLFDFRGLLSALKKDASQLINQEEQRCNERLMASTKQLDFLLRLYSDPSKVGFKEEKRVEAVKDLQIISKRLDRIRKFYDSSKCKSEHIEELADFSNLISLIFSAGSQPTYSKPILVKNWSQNSDFADNASKWHIDAIEHPIVRGFGTITSFYQGDEFVLKNERPNGTEIKNSVQIKGKTLNLSNKAFIIFASKKTPTVFPGTPPFLHRGQFAKNEVRFSVSINLYTLDFFKIIGIRSM